MEIVTVCKGYVKVKLNPLVGADQDYLNFSEDVTLR